MKRIASILLSLIMITAMMPFYSFAEDITPEENTQDAEMVSDETSMGDSEISDEASSEAEVTSDVTAEEGTASSDENSENEISGTEDCGYEEFTFSEGVDPEMIKDEEEYSAGLYEDYLYDEGTSDGSYSANSVKGSRLTGNNLKYYNYFKSIVTNVSACKQSKTYRTVDISKIAGKRKFTAKELGLSRIGYKSGGKWYVDPKAQKKITALIGPQNWNKVWGSLIYDLSASGFWAAWYSKYLKYEWSAPYSYDANSFTFVSGAGITFYIPAMTEFRKAKDSSNAYIYIADLSQIKAANVVKSNAKYIVNAFNDYAASDLSGYSPEVIDYLRLYYYCNFIANVTEYDHESAVRNQSVSESYSMGPWAITSVLDGNDSTKAVCAGYARAFKYLCDLSKFNSKWIDCQIIAGSAGSGENSSHMWDIVRMNDGLNYVVDPTWMDDGDSANTKWFLRGDPNGTAKSFTIEGNTRTYHDYTLTAFLPAERMLAKTSNYNFTSDRAVTLKGTSVRKLAGAKKALTVKWGKVSSHLGALYIDGYQIEYSLNKNFKNSKKVTVKGYASTSRKITKLKSKKVYYVRVRTFAKMGGKTYFSKWSAKKKVRTK